MEPLMKAIILVGGFGTRLQSVISDVPKPMAPIADQPFLAYLLLYLKKRGITHVIFSVHYLREQIVSFFGSDFHGMRIDYVVESEPLGTGGAMVHSLSFIEATEPVFVLNGDTFVKLDYRAMYADHIARHSRLTFALREVADCSRYGKVVTDDQHIISFQEKGAAGRGYINAGVYLMNPDLFNAFTLPAKFSFEADFIFPYLSALRPRYFQAKDYFIDIGIPDDYARAQRELPLMTQP
jgi:D-glycero-alpha-D-manno-heptose 1-phosphate guanylyltransferase